MDFALNNEQEMLRRSFAEFLTKECPFDQVREIKKDEAGYSKDIWKKMARLGWLGLIFEEQYGGSEGSFLDLFVLFEEIGKVLLPSPLFTSIVLAGLLIQESGTDEIKNKYLPPMIDGKKILTVALLNEKGMIDGDNPSIIAKKVPEGDFIINGTRLLVPYANIADEILFCAKIEGDNEGGPSLFSVNGRAQGLDIQPMDTITEEKKYAVVFTNVSVPAANIIGKIGRGDTHLHPVLQKAIVLKCGEMMGGFRQVVDMTVEYAKERHQFGRPIGSFQAIQHYCADMAIDLEGALLIAYQAATLISDGVSCAKEVAMAKAWCSDVYKKATQVSQQIHAGIGFTEEYNIQLFFKHAKESELMFGHSIFHRSKVANEIGL